MAISGDPTSAKLLEALTCLLETAPPERQVRALKGAILMLLSDDAPLPLRGFNGPIPSRQPERWAELVPRLRAVVGRDRDKHAALAGALGIATTTLRRVLGPNSEGPSAIVIDRAEQWLAAQEAPPAKPDLVSPTAKANGNEPPAKAAKAPPLTPQPPPKNRLSEGQRAELGDRLTGLDDMAIRRNLRMTRALADAALGGRELPHEAVERIERFLDAAR